MPPISLPKGDAKWPMVQAKLAVDQSRLERCQQPLSAWPQLAGEK